MVIGRHDSPPTAIAVCARFGNTRYQTDAGLQGLVEVFASLKQACMDSIYRKSAPSRLAGPDIQYSNYPKTNRYHTNKHYKK